MRRSVVIIAAGMLVAALAGGAYATPDDPRSVAAMQHRERVLLTFAPSLDDPRLAAQRRTLARFALGMAERDLVFVQVAKDRVIGAHDTADRLRRTFDVAPAAYRTLLIGKDGNVALKADGPIDEGRLKGAIDAMPMRREEVRRARAGLGKPAE